MSKQVEVAFYKGLFLEKEAQFEQSKAIYEDILRHVTEETVLHKVRCRMDDIDDLITEKAIYQRIDECAKRVLTEIGINIIENQPLVDLLVEADAVDFNNETALFIPLKRDYIEQCLELVPREMPVGPGMNAFGIGATPPFLKRTGDDELCPANREEYEKIAITVGEQQDVVGMFSLPVACDKSISLFEVAHLMGENYHGLKMITTNMMSDDEVKFFKGKGDWVDGTSLIASLATPYRDWNVAGP